VEKVSGRTCFYVVEQYRRKWKESGWGTGGETMSLQTRIGVQGEEGNTGTFTSERRGNQEKGRSFDESVTTNKVLWRTEPGV